MHGSALVVGGGIAGLAVARGLLAAGWAVEVREREAGPPDSGTALGMWPQAMAALARVGVADAVRARSVHEPGGALLRPDGRPLARVGAGARLISRPALHEVLLDGMPSGTVVWGAGVTAPADLRDPDVDVVVGADGIRSAVRGHAFPGAPAPRPLGTVAFRGTLPGLSPGALPGTADAVTETWGRGRLFGITPQHPDAVNWFACVRRELLAGAPPDEGPAALLGRLYRGWHPAVAAVVGRLDDRRVDRRELLEVPRLPSYVAGRNVLVGDAAHAMAPNLGRGACEALLDAAALVEALVAGGTVADGLRRYDRARRGPSRRVAHGSRLMNRVSTATTAAPARDRLLSLVSRVAAPAVAAGGRGERGRGERSPAGRDAA
ncbi:FAD-dependent monooxygenase [Puerhibacterium sp. TATVAM-FAB25]|uniref:FAD-dependent monooxygenase n=1 Tax=Puerhibacterium sp. TATVAM-FAB25 TaxID=3093699 RepID=UPI00397A3B0A